MLAVKLDSRWQHVPPEGDSDGAESIDHLEPGGLYREVGLPIVPQLFISDVCAKPVDVLNDDRRVEVQCTIDTGRHVDADAELQIELQDDKQVISSATTSVRNIKAGQKTTSSLTLTKLSSINLWGLDDPHLYHVVATWVVDGKPLHNHTTRTGFREAEFKPEGFFLNGRRVKLFGSAVFRVIGDGKTLHNSRVMKGDASPREIEVDITKVHQLNLGYARDGHGDDHGDWADARVHTS